MWSTPIQGRWAQCGELQLAVPLLEFSDLGQVMALLLSHWQNGGKNRIHTGQGYTEEEMQYVGKARVMVSG